MSEKDLSAMTTAEITAEWCSLGEDEADLKEDIEALNLQLAPIVAEKQAKFQELQKVESRRKRLRTQYENLGCGDIRKATRGPTQEAVDVAIGQLLSAIGEPSFLPLDDPIVLRRLAVLRDAHAERRKAKRDHAARKQQSNTTEAKGG